MSSVLPANTGVVARYTEYVPFVAFVPQLAGADQETVTRGAPQLAVTDGAATADGAAQLMRRELAEALAFPHGRRPMARVARGARPEP